MTTTDLEPMTKGQRRVYEFIRDHWREHRVSPTFREIMERFKFASLNAVTCHVEPLIEKGWLEQRFRKARSILPTQEALDHDAA
jgi:repressor LexA